MLYIYWGDIYIMKNIAKFLIIMLILNLGYDLRASDIVSLSEQSSETPEAMTILENQEARKKANKEWNKLEREIKSGLAMESRGDLTAAGMNSADDGVGGGSFDNGGLNDVDGGNMGAGGLVDNLPPENNQPGSDPAIY